MSTRSENAYRNFLSGYNCCQSVMLACRDLTGLDEETALMLSSGFSGGIAGTRNVCGTVIGMVMVANMMNGYTMPKDMIGKKRVNTFVQKLLGDFQKQNGSIMCGELLGLKPVQGTNQIIPKKRPCPLLCQDAVEILEKNLDV